MKKPGYEFGPIGSEIEDPELRLWREQHYAEHNSSATGPVAAIAVVADMMMEESWTGHTHSSTSTEQRNVCVRNFVEENGWRTKLSLIKTTPLSEEGRTRQKIIIEYFDATQKLMYDTKLTIFDKGEGIKRAVSEHYLGDDTRGGKKKIWYATTYELDDFADELGRLWDLQEVQDGMSVIFSDTINPDEAERAE